VSELRSDHGAGGTSALTWRALAEALAVSAVVPGLVTAASMFVPEKYVALCVGGIFLGATALLVWRHDDTAVMRAGLTLGGIVLQGPVDAKRIGREALIAIGWAAALLAIVAVPYVLGWRYWWKPTHPFTPQLLFARPADAANEVLGQLVVIALPEEAFYRGYLQSRLDEVWPGRVSILGARVGVGLVAASIIFALGHLATIHSPVRLAVFFPALVFGWLRARTGGIGASIAFHGACNVLSEVLGRGYGIY
jgi:membrane protease YdiL (CAAX protease family)